MNHWLLLWADGLTCGSHRCGPLDGFALGKYLRSVRPEGNARSSVAVAPTGRFKQNECTRAVWLTVLGGALNSEELTER
jgi:hypothetical protein